MLSVFYHLITGQGQQLSVPAGSGCQSQCITEAGNVTVSQAGRALLPLQGHCQKDERRNPLLLPREGQGAGLDRGSVPMAVHSGTSRSGA